jgi:quinol monooxygenase YgiN
MIGIIARVKIKPGVEAQFEEAANRLVGRSREEPGSKGYTLWRTDDPAVYTFVEYYTDAASVEAHGKSDHYRQIGRQLGAFMDGRPEIIRLTSPTL